jgi:hypothetical protein
MGKRNVLYSTGQLIKHTTQAMRVGLPILLAPILTQEEGTANPNTQASTGSTLTGSASAQEAAALAVSVNSAIAALGSVPIDLPLQVASRLRRYIITVITSDPAHEALYDGMDIAVELILIKFLKKIRLIGNILSLGSVMGLTEIENLVTETIRSVVPGAMRPRSQTTLEHGCVEVLQTPSAQGSAQQRVAVTAATAEVTGANPNVATEKTVDQIGQASEQTSQQTDEAPSKQQKEEHHQVQHSAESGSGGGGTMESGQDPHPQPNQQQEQQQQQRESTKMKKTATEDPSPEDEVAWLQHETQMEIKEESEGDKPIPIA